MLFGDIHVEIIDPHAQVQRQPPDRPLILNEDSEIRLLDFLLTIRRRVLEDGSRSTAEELVGHVPIDLNPAIANSFVDIKACLERMRPGDVGGGESLGEAVANLGFAVQERDGVVPKTGLEVLNRNIAGAHPGLPANRPVE